jgi:hypothetical protein
MTASDSNEPKSLWKRQADRIREALENDEQELTNWEEKFLKSCASQISRYEKELSPKQLTCLETIEDIITNGRNKAP